MDTSPQNKNKIKDDFIGFNANAEVIERAKKLSKIHSPKLGKMRAVRIDSKTVLYFRWKMPWEKVKERIKVYKESLKNFRYD